MDSLHILNKRGKKQAVACSVCVLGGGGSLENRNLLVNLGMTDIQVFINQNIFYSLINKAM